MAVFLFSSGMSQNGLGLKTAQFENLGELVKSTIFVALSYEKSVIYWK